jgi:hypothetical protein
MPIGSLRQSHFVWLWFSYQKTTLRSSLDFFCHTFCDGLNHTQAAHYSFFTTAQNNPKKSHKELPNPNHSKQKFVSFQPPPPLHSCQKNQA